MQPMNDHELRKLLLLWKAPATPPGIEEGVLSAARARGKRNWIAWLVRGSVSVPVPALIAVLVLLVLFGMRILQPQLPVRGTLADFQPVKQLKPRIIRSIYEDR